MPGKRPAIRSRRCTRSSSSCCSRSRRSSRRRCRRWPGRCGRRAWRPSAEAAGAVRGIWPGSAGSAGRGPWRAPWRAGPCLAGWGQAPGPGLGGAEVVAGTMALGLLLTWIDEDPGHGPSLLRDYLTATPAVAGYVADEVERRAAEGTRFDGQLAVLQGIAKTGPERAAVTLLAARAAEGSGGSVTAERLAHEASG